MPVVVSRPTDNVEHFSLKTVAMFSLTKNLSGEGGVFGIDTG